MADWVGMPGKDSGIYRMEEKEREGKGREWEEREGGRKENQEVK
jgi:hypothetical protein